MCMKSSDGSSFDPELACCIAPALRMLCSQDGLATVSYFSDIDPSASADIVAGFGETMVIDTDEDLLSAFATYKSANGRDPEIVFVRGLGCFKTSIPDKKKKSGRLAGKIAIVTGGAQGFGKGITETLAVEGAYVVVADLNQDGAAITADELNQRYGAGTAIAVEVDVSDECSVESMIQETVLAYGGLDILVSNAGVLVAGSLNDLSKDSFDLVTKVNYTGYFLCVKHAIKPMKIQHKYSAGYLMDIIEINSKSGLEGSNKNFAYAGSKFGGIGLTQSFAMELIEYGIKVNAICPGNFLDGPLWSDPKRGLFKQYLESGKVEGAKSIDDVRKFYEAKVPMGRGCTIEDVAHAVYYVVEQKYETGQAIPVTGGQIMLR